MRCAIWYNLYYLKSAKNTHGGVLVLVVKVQAKALLLGCFLRFLNCTDGTKSRKASQFVERSEVQVIKGIQAIQGKQNNIENGTRESDAEL